ncbi:MAG: sigma 54-interacting transcriptional regulator [Planctomycetota bacterium]
MVKLSSTDRSFLRALSDLTYCNQFSAERIELEKRALCDQYLPEPITSWSRTADTDRLERPNVQRITDRANETVERLYDKQGVDGSLRGDEAELYHDLVTYVLYYRHVAVLSREAIQPGARHAQVRASWRSFRGERERMLERLNAADRRRMPSSEHAFAVLHQVRRAFLWIFDCFIGVSLPATRLRASVWESIFTHDMRRYQRALYNRMGDFATLVTGPSGAGKELVAQAIARSQYRPFDGRAEALAGDGEDFLALNLTALSPTLIESELFGHRRGAFTGADADRVGWLERCPPHGAVFLDEIGELDATVQVKLLRVAQSRDYSRLGESEVRRFIGKLLAATNRDLAEEMRAGRFREDLYYRLCSDRVVVPSLHEQIADRPEVLGTLIKFLAARVLGDADDVEVGPLSEEVLAFIERDLPTGYEWPGNIRELDQCVRSVLLRRAYNPPRREAPSADRPAWIIRAEAGDLTADELLNAYCRHVHSKQGGYEPAARLLGLDRRTVKNRVVNDP